LTARLVAVLPIVAIVCFVATVGAIVWSAGSTLGYDFQAYAGAADRILHGERLYDPNVDVAGGFAIYLYPPPFALAIVPLAVVGGQVATWAWTLLLVAAFLGGVALLPVGRTVRWLIVLLGALDWPLLYSLKLGQVGPILFLLFAIGWRWLDRPGPLGASIGLGTLIKVQPALLIGWAALTGRWRAAGVAVAVIAAAVLVAVVLLGTAPWIDYPALLARVSSPLTTPHNFTPGAVAFQYGASEATANLIQYGTFAIAIAVSVWAWFRADAESSYVTTVVASQLLSPLLWDHYAMLLLIPTALLLQRRQWWAVAIPLAGWGPPIVFPLLFLVGLVGPLLTAPRRRVDPAPAAEFQAA
jgi:alpha-1,2-mannosyltransferase